MVKKKLNKTKRLIIIGAGEFAEIAYEYFTYDSEYEVYAFAVEKEYKEKCHLFEKPVIEFEELCKNYPTDEYEVFVAIYYTKLNRNRTRLYKKCKELGYKCASYINSTTTIWYNAIIGENVFIGENCTIEYKVTIGNNVMMWSGNIIAHETIIEDNCWLGVGCAVSGFCRIGEFSFIGANATIGNKVIIPSNTVLGAGAVAYKSLMSDGGVYVGNPARLLEDRNSYEQL